ncbi:hypothetical protein U128_03180 [Anaplasma marginale str. Gypsy Plains]|uniref:hypothetical protein n=1 Tax=Anaplasma marginale TaxID=770 RepID=UPI0002E3BACD|nr:hypothetical protein [Anaplasma marginale]AGZ79330.1 hypothetical protein U128_03180 [Anaplasma marginale str. Gypsy Plains]
MSVKPKTSAIDAETEAQAALDVMGEFVEMQTLEELVKEFGVTVEETLLQYFTIKRYFISSAQRCRSYWLLPASTRRCRALASSKARGGARIPLCRGFLGVYITPHSAK